MDKEIKVLHTEWSDGWGGQEIRIINEMIAVRERGIEVYLACRDHAQIKQKALENNIEVFTLPFKGSFDIETMLKLKNIIKKHKINIVNTHSGKDSWVGGFAAKLSGANFIRTRHLSNPINSSRLNFINEMADFIFTTGESIKDAMIKNNRINPSKICSIPTGVDEALFDPNKYDKDNCREMFGIKDNEIAVGILAVLRSFKRHDTFLEIAKKIKDKYSDKKFKFLIAGEGPKRESIEQKIDDLDLKENVVMLGHIENTPEFLKSLDLFLLTSDRNEGVPQSLIQALMMELSIVATNAGSIKDLYKNQNFLISEPTVELIFKNTAKLIENRATLNKDRTFIVNNFGKSSIASKIIEIYNRLIA